MLKGLWPYWRPHAHWWVASTAASIGSVACGLTIPRLVGQTIDDLRSGDPPGALVSRYVVLMIVAAAGAALLLILMRNLAPVSARRIAADLRTALVHRLTELEPGYFQRHRTGDLLNRFAFDAASVQNLLGLGMIGLINLSLSSALTFYFMFKLSAQLGLVMLATYPVVLGLIVLMLRSASGRYAQVRAQQSELASKIQESLSGIRMIRASGSEAHDEHGFREVQDRFRRKVLSHARVKHPVGPLARLLLHGVFVAALLVVARPLIMSGAPGQVAGITLGSFVAFITYLFLLAVPLVGLGVVVDVCQQGIVSWSRIRMILEAVPAIRSGPRELPESFGDVRFENVTLKIGDRLLLDDVSFEIPNGQTIGVTGRTGSGKSLLGLLLARQLDPTSGRVTIGGIDLRELSLQSLRSRLGVVLQEPFLFSRSIAENIDPGATPDPERVRRAADLADLTSNVEAFPNKFDTVVGERGLTLSGGQRQRTALARALARGAPLLILDDALSAVDVETESRILAGLKRSLQGRTVLLIGHRVATFQHADQLLVLEAGRVVERGTHDQLIAANGAYADLERRQRVAEGLELHG